MNNSVTAIGIFIALVLVLVAASCKTMAKPEGITQKKETERTKYYEIIITKPVLKETVPYANEINTYIDVYIGMQRKNFLTIVNAYVKQWGGEKALAFHIDWKFYHLDDEVFSCMLILSGYAGGPHGYTKLFPVNIDLKNGKEITQERLPEYVANMANKKEKSLSDILQTASALSEPQVRTQLKASKNAVDDDLIKTGLQPTNENFALFTLTKKDLVFHFKEYQVGPHSAGNLNARIPYKMF